MAPMTQRWAPLQHARQTGKWSCDRSYPIPDRGAMSELNRESPAVSRSVPLRSARPARPGSAQGTPYPNPLAPHGRRNTTIRLPCSSDHRNPAPLALTDFVSLPGVRRTGSSHDGAWPRSRLPHATRHRRMHVGRRSLATCRDAQCPWKDAGLQRSLCSGAWNGSRTAASSDGFVHVDLTRYTRSVRHVAERCEILLHDLQRGRQFSGRSSPVPPVPRPGMTRSADMTRPRRGYSTVPAQEDIKCVSDKASCNDSMAGSVCTKSPSRAI